MHKENFEELRRICDKYDWIKELSFADIDSKAVVAEIFITCKRLLEFVPEFIKEYDKLDFWLKELENQNDPQWDATDAAHPAWWRGNDYAYTMVCAKIEKILSGEDKGKGAFGGKELESIRRKILELLDK